MQGSSYAKLYETDLPISCSGNTIGAPSFVDSNFFDEWFWRKPKGSTNAVRSDTFASHWYLGEIYLILFFISLVIVAGIFRIIYIYSCRIKKIYCTCRCFEYNHNTLSDDIKDKSKPLVNPIADNV